MLERALDRHRPSVRGALEPKPQLGACTLQALPTRMSLPDSEKVGAGEVFPEEDVEHAGGTDRKVSLGDVPAVTTWRWAVLSVFAISRFLIVYPSIWGGAITTIKWVLIVYPGF